jgi:hypothetical protein
MCDFCDNDAVGNSEFYSKDGFQVTAYLCEKHQGFNRNPSSNVYAEEFNEKVEEMAYNLFGDPASKYGIKRAL